MSVVGAGVCGPQTQNSPRRTVGLVEGPSLSTVGVYGLAHKYLLLRTDPLFRVLSSTPPVPHGLLRTHPQSIPSDPTVGVSEGWGILRGRGWGCFYLGVSPGRVGGFGGGIVCRERLGIPVGGKRYP